MYINIFYDEDIIADIVFVPDNIMDIEKLQYSFIDWMFDKNNNHKYWVCEEGIKKYCSYGTSAFVEWINEIVLNDADEKARIIKEYTREFCSTDISLRF